VITTLQHIREVKTVLPRRVVDGDTWWCHVDMDYHQIGFFEYRLDGWDTPEKQSTPLVKVTEAEKLAAKQATAAAMDWWAIQIREGDRRIFIKTEPDPEKYGRWLGALWAETAYGQQYFLGQYLQARELAVPSDGTKGTRWRDTYGQAQR
jgi:endonuclease YncB( thermonuclease family)